MNQERLRLIIGRRRETQTTVNIELTQNSKMVSQKSAVNREQAKQQIRGEGTPFSYQAL